MNTLVKKIINALGFELHRAPTIQKEPIKSYKTQNATIELIGPSGIGKTTLRKMVSKHLKFRWNLSYTTNTRTIGNISNQLDEFYRIILYRKLISLYEQEKEVDRYAKLSAFFIKRMQQDRHLKLSGLLDKGGWFLDDGFCHNFTLEILQAMEKNELENEVLNKFFENRNFILLEAPINRIVENLKNRQVNYKGAGNDLLIVYGEKGIKQFIQKSINNKRKMVELSLQYGARFYTINMMQSDGEIIGQVRDIEHEVLTKI